jgi:hypothetical protein
MAQVHNLKWTGERLDLLKALVAKKYPASKIAGIMDVSRNAVIGAVHRHIGKMALDGGLPKAVIADTLRPARSRRSKPPQFPTAQRLAQEPIMAGDKITVFMPLTMLQAHTCKWAMTDVDPGGTHLFCDEVVSGAFGLGRSYCAKHAARAIAPRQPKPMNKPIAIPARAFR